MIYHLQAFTLVLIKDGPTILYENNVTCFAHLEGKYIKWDKTMYILQNSSIHGSFKRLVTSISTNFSSDNVNDLLTKA